MVYIGVPGTNLESFFCTVCTLGGGGESYGHLQHKVKKFQLWVVWFSKGQKSDPHIRVLLGLIIVTSFQLYI